MVPVLTLPHLPVGPGFERGTDYDKTALNAIFDRRLRRIDHAVWATLTDAHGFDEFAMDVDLVEALSRSLWNWGAIAAPNKIALSLKRLARCGYVANLPRSVFRFGLETKAVPKKLRAAVLDRDKVCQLCGTAENLQIDHRLARSKGGETTLENLQVLCLRCNVRKGDQ